MKRKLLFIFLIICAFLFNLALYKTSLNTLINDYYKNVIILIGINIILATSLNLINGFTGQFSLGHAGFMAVGGYVSISIATYFRPLFIKLFGDGPFGDIISFSILLIIAGISAAIVGIIVGVPSFRLKGDYLAIITLGFSEIIRVVIQGLDIVGGPQGFNVVYIYDNGQKALESIAGLEEVPFSVYQVPKFTNFFWTYLFVIIIIFFIVNLVKSTWGKGFIAVKDDEIAAEAMGINTTKYKIIAFVTGAFFAGIAGSLLGHHTQTLIPEDFNFLRSVEIVVMVILGGMGNIPGVVIAAILLSILPELLRDPQISIIIIFSLPYILFIFKFYKRYKDKFSLIIISLLILIMTGVFIFAIYILIPIMINNIPNISTLRMIIYALLLIIMMANRPQGLFGTKISLKPIRKLFSKA